MPELKSKTKANGGSKKTGLSIDTERYLQEEADEIAILNRVAAAAGQGLPSATQAKRAALRDKVRIRSQYNVKIPSFVREMIAQQADEMGLTKLEHFYWMCRKAGIDIPDDKYLDWHKL